MFVRCIDNEKYPNLTQGDIYEVTEIDNGYFYKMVDDTGVVQSYPPRLFEICYGESQPKYYCTHCRADLSKQEGFSIDCVSWDCLECGNALYGNGIKYDGERYKNVIWCCEKCEDILNNQEGFTDLKDQWECLKCGTINDIVFEEDEDNIANESYTYVCTRCGAVTHGPNCEYCGVTLDEFKTD